MRAATARSSGTGTVAAIRAAVNGIRVIRQPGMRPPAMARIGPGAQLLSSRPGDGAALQASGSVATVSTGSLAAAAKMRRR